MQNSTFKNFSEFWHYTKGLLDSQRTTLFDSLPPKERKKLEASYDEGGWQDLFMRNKLDKILECIKIDFGIDLLAIRGRVLKGKSYYMKRAEWEWIEDLLGEYSEKYTQYILGGIKIEKVNKETVCFVNERK